MTKNIIKPTKAFDKDEKRIFILKDEDYLLITAIQELTEAIKNLTRKT